MTRLQKTFTCVFVVGSTDVKASPFTEKVAEFDKEVDAWLQANAMLIPGYESQDCDPTRQVSTCMSDSLWIMTVMVEYTPMD